MYAYIIKLCTFIPFSIQNNDFNVLSLFQEGEKNDKKINHFFIFFEVENVPAAVAHKGIIIFYVISHRKLTM